MKRFIDKDISEYSYDLPPERIAVYPTEQRDQSRLLVYKDEKILDTRFKELPEQIPAGHLLVFNDTRVIEARILFQKTSGASIEIFCLEPFEQDLEAAMQQKETAVWKCLIGGASKWKSGQVLQKSIHEKGVVLEAHYVSTMEDHFLIRFFWKPADLSFVEVLHKAGAIPLPPYIKRKAIAEDAERYQTIFSKNDGSVAAPTASLHFTPNMLTSLEEKKIGKTFLTLHVGAGTFKPVQSANIAEHTMHGEPFSVSKITIKTLLQSDNIIAVGTTSLRTLESLYWLGVKMLHNENDTDLLHQWEAYELGLKYNVSKTDSLQALLNWMEATKSEQVHCKTSLMIVPGYVFKMVEGLITNFHQPQSTLLLLVAAFIGEDWKRLYTHALTHNFRFLSYGDSSLLWKHQQQ
jgi:S-adenosylmethionine:tRNA ribosyltransferase-isomerase